MNYENEIDIEKNFIAITGFDLSEFRNFRKTVKSIN